MRLVVLVVEPAVQQQLLVQRTLELVVVELFLPQLAVMAVQV
jgi:hypothetical protein